METLGKNKPFLGTDTHTTSDEVVKEFDKKFFIPKNKLEELTERIVAEYANLSGRESANRAKFRKRIEYILKKYLNN